MLAMTRFSATPARYNRRQFSSLLSAQTLALASAWTAVSAPATQAAEPLLARNAPKGIDPTGYLVSEKHDGVRALWDGKQLRFRSGRLVAAPAWFTAKLPTTALDGELWLARGQFDALSGIVRKTVPVDAEWQRVQYMVFELPQGKGRFEERAEQLYDIVKAAAWPQLHAVTQMRISTPAALQAKLKATVDFGGEGLMLHLASAPVTTGRSDVLLKLKRTQDAEAIVVAHVPGKGKYTNQLGALEVKTADGQQFKLGTGLTDAQRQNPPAIGSIITYTYRDLTPQGVPRFASFLRVFDGV